MIVRDILKSSTWRVDFIRISFGRLLTFLWRYFCLSHHWDFSNWKGFLGRLKCFNPTTAADLISATFDSDNGFYTKGRSVNITAGPDRSLLYEYGSLEFIFYLNSSSQSLFLTFLFLTICPQSDFLCPYWDHFHFICPLVSTSSGQEHILHRTHVF